MHRYRVIVRDLAKHNEMRATADTCHWAKPKRLHQTKP